MNNLAFLLSSVGDADTAGRLYAGLATKCAAAFGAMHPHTLAVFAGRAGAMKALNEFSEARLWQSYLTTLYGKKLGKDHEATVRAREELAHLAEAADRSRRS